MAPCNPHVHGNLQANPHHVVAYVRSLILADPEPSPLEFLAFVNARLLHRLARSKRFTSYSTVGNLVWMHIEVSVVAPCTSATGARSFLRVSSATLQAQLQGTSCA